MRWTLPFAALLLLGLGGCGDTASQNSEENQSAGTNPLYRYAWHLHAPDSAFADDYGIDPSANVHAEAAWERSRGHGVRVAVLDDYFDPGHPDIRQNVLLTYNAKTGGSDISHRPVPNPTGSSAPVSWAQYRTPRALWESRRRCS